MNIGSGNGYPGATLSNFAPHKFSIDGVECNSMEGFLQSLKFKNPEMQKEICKLVGKAAKLRGLKKNWWRTQTLWWQGKKIDRHSQDYQELLDRAFEALARNEGFRKALLATKSAVLTHSIGESDPSATVLTQREFCSRLTKLRDRLRRGQES